LQPRFNRPFLCSGYTLCGVGFYLLGPAPFLAIPYVTLQRIRQRKCISFFHNIFLITYIHTHTRLTALCPELPRCSRYQKGKTNLDFTEARDSEWQWHQLGHMQVCTSLQTDNHASTPPLRFLQAGCPSCRPTNSVKTLSLSVILFAVRRLARGAQMRPVSTHVLTLRGLCVEHNRQPCRSG